MQSPKRYFVTGISTDSGKTIFAALLAAAMNADYWKPVQAGIPTDADTVRRLVPHVHVHQERYALQMPASPHLAAQKENVVIKLSDFECPAHDKPLVIEGAGGLLVPLNKSGDFVIDLAKKFQAEVILVANIYLGSINHTLLSIRELEKQQIPCRYVVFNQEAGSPTPDIILKNSSLKQLYHLPQLTSFSTATLQTHIDLLRRRLVEEVF